MPEVCMKKNYVLDTNVLIHDPNSIFKFEDIIIDECQNATPNQILSIVTRASEGSKIVLLGDVNQIDNIRLDSRNNGLVYAIERMKGSDICEITSFYESECTRSRLAKEAAERMKK